ncbi:TOMM precursor leader peptide-binding protein [Streptomyces sp. NPDC019645]|uniref:TOMM precursor leader peptide-binding protein n=1 Tax=Streptomyces sp. NPDC019645 TaxID=3154786 RepID=UPI0034040D50
MLGLRPPLRAAVVPGEAVYVFADDRVVALRGPHIERIVPLLDGTRDRVGVLNESAAWLDPHGVGRTLDRLVASGLLHERAVDPGRAAQDAYWELAGAGAPTAEEPRTDAVHVRVLGGGGPGDGEDAAGAAGVHDAVRAAGLRVVPDPSAGGLTVVVCADYLEPDLARLDAEHRAEGRPWLPVRPGGRVAWLGPFFGLADGPCWHCLAVRLWQVRPVEAHLRDRLGLERPVPQPVAELPASRAAALQLALLEAAKWLQGHRSADQGRLFTFDTLTLEGSRHAVVRRPQCEACGDPGIERARVEAPVVLRSRPKAEAGGNGHRALSAGQMWDTYRHLVDPVTGPVREIRRDTRGPAFLNCFHAGYNPVLGPDSGLDSVRAGLRGTSSGKGATGEQARVSALGEAVERLSGCLHGTEPRVRARYRDLAEEAVHPDAVQLFHPRQLAERKEWNARHSAHHHVCDPFDAGAEVDWTPVWSLTEQRRRLLPTALLYYHVPQPEGRQWFFANSNGAAAGGSLEDAVLQGFLELVERDAVALWWYNRTVQPAVDLAAFDDGWITRCHEVHAQLGREVWALDLTSDFGIPVVAALARRIDKPAEDVMLGFGAHFDPAVAVRRALTELNQLLPPVLGATPDGSGYECRDPHALAWLRHATLENQPYLRASSPSDLSPLAQPRRHDLLDDIDHAVGLLRERGLEMLVLDQTRPDMGLPVVKVIVPGLRPHWARFAPGRLYDVPVRLGRLSAPTPYEQLNPIALFL